MIVWYEYRVIYAYAMINRIFHFLVYILAGYLELISFTVLVEPACDLASLAFLSQLELESEDRIQQNHFAIRQE